MFHEDPKKIMHMVKAFKISFAKYIHMTKTFCP